MSDQDTAPLRLVPKKWASFQHYKNRKPPWIKLHRAMLDDRAFACLPIASKALAPLLWLLASETENGEFDASTDELVFRLRFSREQIEEGLKSLIDKGFFCVASGSLACRKQIASAETEVETEEEISEEDKSSSSSAKPTKQGEIPCQFDRIIDAYHEHLPMLPSVRIVTEKRKRAMRQRWAWVLSSRKANGERRATNADEAIRWFCDYFARCADDDFISGRSPRGKGHEGWQADIGYLMREECLVRIAEKTLKVAA